MNILRYVLLLTTALVFSSCGERNKSSMADSSTANTLANTNKLTISASDFIDSNGQVEKNGSSITLSGDDAWVSYDVEIPAAGRYRVSLEVASKDSNSSAWIEDYIDNKDDRTYNITSQMTIPSNQEKAFSVIYKDGSPLNAGLHKMKIHFQNGSTSFKSFSFELLKSHQVTPTTLEQKTDGEEWQVVWSDEFDGNGAPDTTKWTYDIGNWGWGNGELQYYTEGRKENARLEDGNLIIEARKNDLGNPWTSARLTTRGKVSFLYGKIEFRAIVPPNKGNWAAGWTLGDEYVDELSWPYCGEIDILESVGYEMNDTTGLGKAHASAHCGAYYFKLGNQPTGITEVKNMHDSFHVYAIEWTPEGITATVDGKEYFRYEDNSTELSWPFNKSQNIILNLTMGGGWGGAQGMDETVSSQKMILDYVRVYEKR